jgi:hypothetical protein
MWVGLRIWEDCYVRVLYRSGGSTGGGLVQSDAKITTKEMLGEF